MAVKPKTLRVGIVGCGLIGSRRAAEVERHPGTDLVVTVDTIAEKSNELSDRFDCVSADKWDDVIDDESLDVVVVSTPNAFTVEIAIKALQAGKHVLLEKPPGRNLAEAVSLAKAAQDSRAIMKIGFNHRYHPAIMKARELFVEGFIGSLINIRARYGHGGRPGYEKEWRGSAELAGGGELTDQGVHVVDLINWFAGHPHSVFGVLQTAAWPIEPLEDNAFGILTFPDKVVASIHTSWTQWKNLFSFEVFGELGSISIEGLGGSYGVETLSTSVRRSGGGAPKVTEETFDEPDLSWKREWEQLVRAINHDEEYWGGPTDGIATMSIIDGLYRSAIRGEVVEVTNDLES